MTRDEILRVEGRELDAAVHQHIFGRRVKRATKMVSINGGEWLPLRRVPADPDTGSDVPHYSTDIDAAWQVVERMFERGFYPEISYDSDGTGRHDKAKVYVIFHTEDHYCGWPCGANAVKDVPQRVPTAICRAALLAVMFGAGDVARSRQREGTR